ncbi:MAG: hypothetical protein LBV34_09935, partial [Nocardiopsaceae bacterium]|nr:hypothetical protein [Nocardiopsaceae bacterium]
PCGPARAAGWFFAPAARQIRIGHDEPAGSCRARAATIVGELHILKTPDRAIRIAPTATTLAFRGTRMNRLIMRLPSRRHSTGRYSVGVR